MDSNNVHPISPKRMVPTWIKKFRSSANYSICGVFQFSWFFDVPTRSIIDNWLMPPAPGMRVTFRSKSRQSPQMWEQLEFDTLVHTLGSSGLKPPVSVPYRVWMGRNSSVQAVWNSCSLNSGPPALSHSVAHHPINGKSQHPFYSMATTDMSHILNNLIAQT